MGRDATAMIGYGVEVDLWTDTIDNVAWEGMISDFEEWWAVENGAPPQGEVWSKEIYQEQQQVLFKNPSPVGVYKTGHCDGDEEYIIAIPSTYRNVDYGPIKINIEEPTEAQVNAFFDFLQKYKIPVKDKIGWQLASYYG